MNMITEIEVQKIKFIVDFEYIYNDYDPEHVDYVSIESIHIENTEVGDVLAPDVLEEIKQRVLYLKK